MKIKCIFCGLEVERNESLIHHISNHHRIKEGLNFLLAGCLMQKNEREELNGIFQGLIESLVSSPAADVSQEFGKATEIFGETCKRKSEEKETPYTLSDDVSKNSNGFQKVKYTKKIVSTSNIGKRMRKSQGKFTKDDLHRDKLVLENRECCKSKFKLEDWGFEFEFKNKIRRLGKNTGKFETDPKLPPGWTVRYYGRNSKYSSKDFVTPDKRYYVKTYNAVIKYMRLSGDYSDYLIRETADSLGVKLEEIEVAEFKINNQESCKEMATAFDLKNNKDSVEEIVAKMDDERLLKEVEDEMNSSG